MTAEQLASLISKHGASTMAQHIRETFAYAALEEGWDLTNWNVKSGKGALLFYQIERRDGKMFQTSGERICVLNAPESERAKWEETIRGVGDAAVRLLLQPGMVADATPSRRIRRSPHALV